ncbi:hypothetical protein FA15DRAFT_336329 [Coprinopsis marcescibilis]|uniref:Uncharacterized protein n=1 Tax=Coprinopsis marcescibilis TaxID=230819 RepID=A0A5C3KZ70_COPMA|nr:hypothetical protein FA15DRAFT_336329 [Coprinopsis marcescibilis]
MRFAFDPFNPQEATQPPPGIENVFNDSNRNHLLYKHTDSLEEIIDHSSYDGSFTPDASPSTFREPALLPAFSHPNVPRSHSGNRRDLDSVVLPPEPKPNSFRARRLGTSMLTSPVQCDPTRDEDEFSVMDLQPEYFAHIYATPGPANPTYYGSESDELLDSDKTEVELAVEMPPLDFKWTRFDRNRIVRPQQPVQPLYEHQLSKWDYKSDRDVFGALSPQQKAMPSPDRTVEATRSSSTTLSNCMTSNKFSFSPMLRAQSSSTNSYFERSPKTPSPSPATRFPGLRKPHRVQERVPNNVNNPTPPFEPVLCAITPTAVDNQKSAFAPAPGIYISPLKQGETSDHPQVNTKVSSYYLLDNFANAHFNFLMIHNQHQFVELASPVSSQASADSSIRSWSDVK